MIIFVGVGGGVGPRGDIGKRLLNEGRMAMPNEEATYTREWPGEREEQHPHGGTWLRDFIFGANDGMVTTLVFVLSVSALASSRHALVLTALAELLAGGVSMALGGYLAVKTQQEVTDHQIDTERHEIANEPAEERAELRAAYSRKGLTGALLDQVVEHQTATPERWLHAMVRDELGLVADRRERPIVQGLLVGGSFMIGALAPILPFLTPLANPQPWAFATTAVALMGIGILKSRYTLKGPLRSGLELVLVISLGALAGVLISLLLSK